MPLPLILCHTISLLKSSVFIHFLQGSFEIGVLVLGLASRADAASPLLVSLSWSLQ